MDPTVTIEVDVDADGSPPAEATLRQLLDLVRGLKAARSDFEWRLVSLSMNSPVTATLEPRYSDGAAVPSLVADRVMLDVTHALAALTDTDPVRAYERSSRETQRVLKSFDSLRTGRARIAVTTPMAGRIEFRTEQVQRLHEAMARPQRRRKPELGSVEGVIVSARRERDKPVLLVKDALTGRQVTCTFADEIAEQLGERHSLREIWEGRRVLVSGLIHMSPSGGPERVEGDTLRTFDGGSARALAARVSAARDSVETDPGAWGDLDA